MLFCALRQSEFSPSDFFEAFKRCKKYLLTGRITLNDFTELLLRLSKIGIQPEECPIEMEKLMKSLNFGKAA